MIRIVLAEDQALLRGALAGLLALESDIDVVAEAGDGDSAWKAVQQHQPDLLLTDIEMPGLTGLDLAAKVQEAKLATRVVIVTTFARGGYLRRALDAGVRGYLLKDAPVEKLAQALRDVHRGGRAIAPELAVDAWREEADPLTDRERAVLRLAGEGLSSQDIAEQLHLSNGTVRNYLSEAIGKLGAEESHERLLHCITGFERVETSAGGRAVRSLANQPSISGSTVVLTIDVRLQKLVEDMFGDRRGALVAIDPRNGDVLAFVSKPTFDPNLFVDGIDVDNWRALNDSPDKPLLNRALRGTYPPGSTYKPFMALGALETGTRNVNTTINDPGFWMFGNHRFRSHGESSLGAVDLNKSIVKSSNTYYYSLANEMGVDTIHDFMKPLGFGQLTGIDVGGEVRGVLPSQAWKRNSFKNPEQKRWIPGETISLGIGQGYNTFTMLQLAHAMATLANQGKKHTPHITASVQDPATGQQISRVVSTPIDLGYKAEHVQAVLEAMYGVTVEGTSARVFAGTSYKSGGKTGTAQAVTIGQSERYDAAKLLESQRDHSLYVAFAPLEAPQVALAVVVENAGFGAAHAAPIARRVFDYLLLDQYPNEQDLAAVRLGQAASPIGKPLKASEMPWPPKDTPVTIQP
jgi:penicillin-binding protein 2